jgi:hypothetical protein
MRRDYHANVTRTMRPIRETIPLEEALALILEAAAPVERTERVALWDACGWKAPIIEIAMV